MADKTIENKNRWSISPHPPLSFISCMAALQNTKYFSPMIYILTFILTYILRIRLQNNVFKGDRSAVSILIMTKHTDKRLIINTVPVICVKSVIINQDIRSCLLFMLMLFILKMFTNFMLKRPNLSFSDVVKDSRDTKRTLLGLLDKMLDIFGFATYK